MLQLLTDFKYEQYIGLIIVYTTEFNAQRETDFSTAVLCRHRSTAKLLIADVVNCMMRTVVVQKERQTTDRQTDLR